MKNENYEVLLEFEDLIDTKELDEKIYNFEKKLKNITQKYFLKETENPFIYFLENPNPTKLIKKLQHDEELKQIKATPVICVTNNQNYIVSTIRKKLRNKTKFDDSFNITCHLDVMTRENAEEIEIEISKHLENIINIPKNAINPTWDIHLHILGEITAINIKRSNKNRNKFVKYAVELA